MSTLTNEEIAINLIDIYWKDIHHSRNQDWKFLLAVLTSILGLGQSYSIVAKMGFSLLGLGISLIGAIIANEHRRLLVKKTGVIEQLERILSKDDPETSKYLPYYEKICGTENRDMLSVSGLIFLFYFLFLGFFGAACVYFYPSIRGQWPSNNVFGVAISFIGIGLILMLYSGRVFKNERERLFGSKKSLDTGKSIYMTISKSKISEYFKASKGKPLKIVVDHRRKGEQRWTEGNWDFDFKNGEITKDIHLNPKDLFQFSVADEHTEQEFHCHNALYEIYLSDSKFELFLEENSEHPINIDDGALIIPPGVLHSVKLSGITYIFQAAASKKAKVSRDKSMKNKIVN